MFWASLRPSSGGQTALHCPWCSVLLQLLWCWRVGWQDVCTVSFFYVLQYTDTYYRQTDTSLETLSFSCLWVNAHFFGVTEENI